MSIVENFSNALRRIGLFPAFASTTPIMSKAGVVAWLKTKDPRQPYNFMDWQNCAVSQYLRARKAFNRKNMSAFHVTDRSELALVSYAACGNSTFGGFLRELERT